MQIKSNIRKFILRNKNIIMSILALYFAYKCSHKMIGNNRSII